MRGLEAVLMVWATASGADPAGNIVDLSGSTAILRPTSRPGAIAEIFFDNKYVNSDIDIGSYRLKWNGLTIPFNFEWQVPDTPGDDAVVVHPPEGITCLPTSCRLQLPEDESNTMYLFSTEGVGM